MPPVLVSPSEFLAHVDEIDGDVAVAERLLTAVEARLASESGRADHPFAEAASRTEVRDGTGTAVLYLHYTVGALTSVTLGFDPAAPDETLDIADPDVFLSRVGSRRLTRRDGRFGVRGAPDYVRVVYTTEADLPVLAAQAVLEMAAALWRGQGSEGVSAERLGSYSVEFGTLTEQLPSWRAAVSAELIPL